MTNLIDSSRYIVGIDLGTTNCAAAFIDTLSDAGRVTDLLLPQLVAPAVIEARDTLPSFHYEPVAGEFDPAALCLPWENEPAGHLVGLFAREHGAEAPARLITSAKSWLCHGGVDRTAEILPWHAADDVTRLSPSAVCARYLLHIRQAWNAEHPRHPLEEQEVVVTVPASFDEVARELTIRAAALAGLPRILLIEEPQAAFYNWMHEQGDGAADITHPGETILVCDIGGGTTDFTLIQAQPAPEGAVRFHRIAVGDHLILGGDNLDLALARHIEQREPNLHLSPAQYAVLIRRCRHAKETLLAADAPEEITLNIPGAGARLIASSIQLKLTRAEALETLVDGFLPRCAMSDDPAKPVSGFREFGLPFAADHAITRYLAQFLRRHGDASGPARPDALLFNGGFFAAPRLCERLIETLRSWFAADAAWNPALLDNPRLFLAVARGAACYGLARRGQGQRIKAGLPRSYYIGVTSRDTGEQNALCLVPAGLEEGEHVEIADRTFSIRIRQPVEFPIYTSALRTTDQPGDLIAPDPEQLTALPPIRTVLQSGRKKEQDQAEVRLHAHVNETGMLQVACRETSGDRAWNLRFDVRSATHTEIQAHAGLAERQGFLDSAAEEGGREQIRNTFAGDAPPDSLLKQIELHTSLRRTEWPSSLLRAFWDELIDLQDARKRSPQHESRWLNLAGFCLRPGYGFAVDDWRIARLWPLIQQKHAFPRNEQCCGEWWILWRRIAGGLTANQQKNLAAPLIAGLRAAARGSKGKALKAGAHEYAEIQRLLASLEWLDIDSKRFLGEQALAAMEQKGAAVWNRAALWAIARLGARIPLYGPLNTLVPPELAEDWLKRLMHLNDEDAHLAFAVMQLARRTHDRFRDLPEPRRAEAVDWMTRHRASAHYLKLVAEGGEMESDEITEAFGDTLPAGLLL